MAKAKNEEATAADVTNASDKAAPAPAPTKTIVITNGKGRIRECAESDLAHFERLGFKKV